MDARIVRITLIEIATAVVIVLALAGILLVLSIPMGVHSRMIANQIQAVGELRKIVVEEVAWKNGDFDLNGRADYWTRDLAALHCGWDPTGRPRARIDRDLALADAEPARDYPELGRPSRETIPKFQGVAVQPKQCYAYQAMSADPDGKSYVEAGAPRPAAKNLPAAPCTNSSRFGFTAYPAGYQTAGVLVFVVGEDGVVWQNDIEESYPICSWKPAHVGTARLGWARAGL